MTERPEEGASLQEHQRALYTLLEEFDRVCKKLSIPYILFAGTMLGAVRHQGFIPWDDDVDVLMLRQDYDRFLREAEAVLDQDRFFLQKEFSAHWPLFFSKLRLNGTTCLEKYHPRDPMTHQGVYMDIFPCDNGAGTALGRRLQFWASKVVIAKALDARGYDTASLKKKAVISLCRLLPGKPFLWLTKRGSDASTYVHSFLGAASSYSKNVFPRAFFLQRTRMPFEEGNFPVSRCYDAMLTQMYGEYMRLPPPEDRECKKHAILVDLERSHEYYRDYRDGMAFSVYTRSIR
nr:LicD family protein [Oscillospiraceae bacterium]